MAFGSIWVPGHHDRTTTRIDPVTNKVIAVIAGTGDHAEDVEPVGDVLWITGQQDDTTWVDPKTDSVPSSAPHVPGHLHYIAYAFGAAWITTADNEVDRVDPATGNILAAIPYAEGMADCQGFVDATATSIWIEDCDTQELIRIDPATNTVASKTPYATLIKQAEAHPAKPAGGGRDALWIVVPQDQLTSGSSYSTGLLRIDPRALAGLAFLPLTPQQAGGGFVDVTDGSVWLGGLGQISRVNVATNQVDATYATDPGSTIKPVVGFGSVWIENYDQNLVQRLDVVP